MCIAQKFPAENKCQVIKWYHKNSSWQIPKRNCLNRNGYYQVSIMNFVAYIKNILLLAFLLVILTFIYPIMIEHTPIHLKYKDGIIYTTQNAMILGISFGSIFLYVILKFVYIFIAKTFFIPDFLLIVKKIFSFQKEDNNILEKIKKVTDSNLQVI